MTSMFHDPVSLEVRVDTLPFTKKQDRLGVLTTLSASIL